MEQARGVVLDAATIEAMVPLTGRWLRAAVVLASQPNPEMVACWIQRPDGTQWNCEIVGSRDGGAMLARRYPRQVATSPMDVSEVALMPETADRLEAVAYAQDRARYERETAHQAEVERAQVWAAGRFVDRTNRGRNGDCVRRHPARQGGYIA